MNVGALAFAGLVALGLFIMAIGLASSPKGRAEGSHSQVLQRFENYLARSQTSGPVEIAVPQTGRQLLARLPLVRLATRGRLSTLPDQLDRADVSMAPHEWLLTLLVSGVVIFLVAGLRFNVVVGLLLAIALPILAGRAYLTVRWKRKVNAFNDELGAFLIGLSSTLRAGYSFAQALDLTTKASRPPVSTEFQRVLAEVQLGLSLDDALKRLVERSNSEELDLAVTAVAINRVVGGNLAVILSSIAETIRDRARIKAEVRTLTAQGRISAWIVSVLPIGLAAILIVIAPDYFGPMVRDGFGILLLGLALISMMIGWTLLRSIVRVEY